MSGLSVESTHSNAKLLSGVDFAPSGGSPSTEIIPPRAGKFLAPRVLVVDDEALLRWSLAEMLSTAGYDVVEAPDGREARRVFGEPGQRIDAMLLDLKLPDTSGLLLLQEARRRCVSCPIILMTAYGSTDTIDAALASGAFRVVSKPFDLDDMLHLLQQLCPLPPR